ncbi:hypothetical protein MP228_000773 [Amoeboaphelidium protococcarum]|nr:hypothetical protein MP228_000773 [Amoeboaphelidium protococcarum]
MYYSLALTTFSCIAALVAAQTAPLQQKVVQWKAEPTRYSVDAPRLFLQESSGNDYIAGLSPSHGVVMEELVEIDGAEWIRIAFDIDSTQLHGGALLVIQSVADASFYQKLDARALRQWQHTSAYFNGNAVKVMLVQSMAESTSAQSQFRITSVSVGDSASSDQESLTLCTKEDRRRPIKDARVARMYPTGCTGWLIDDEHHCFLTAGHCYPRPRTDPRYKDPLVMQFNVPLSMKNGTVNHPHPKDQYPVDLSSVQFVNGGIGRDYMHYGTFVNSNTGKAAFEVQSAWYNTSLIDVKSVLGQNVTINGCGVVRDPKIQYKSQTLQTHYGTLKDLYDSRIRFPNNVNPYLSLDHLADTTGGNSGSAIEVTLQDGSRVAIGIHTHGGCSPYSFPSVSRNHGTQLRHPGLQKFLRDPRGVCKYGYAQ